MLVDDDMLRGAMALLFQEVKLAVEPAGAAALARELAAFDGGRIVVNVIDLPIKCPVAPLEFCFLADWFFTERGIRDQVQITYATPLDGAFTKPIASEALGGKGGGGRRDMAQAGGPDGGKAQGALDAVAAAMG